MARLAILVSASSIFLVATWLLVMANHNHEYVHRLDGPPNFTRDIDHGSPPPDGVLPPDAVKAVEATKLEIQQDLQAKRKRTVKGVTVDRKAVIEDVSLDDLRAPEGRMWIPAAIIGPLNPKALDPFFHVLVAYCQLDMAAYHETPWLFAMGTFHQRHSGCLTDPNLVKTYRLSSLAVSSHLEICNRSSAQADMLSKVYLAYIFRLHGLHSYGLFQVFCGVAPIDSVQSCASCVPG